jgi:hypothetical protein
MASPPPQRAPRPLKFWPFLLVGLSAFAIAKISVHPRLRLTKDEAGWSLRYDYAYKSAPAPADKGYDLSPAGDGLAGFWQDPRNAFKQLRESSDLASKDTTSPRHSPDNPHVSSRSRLAERNTSWILDTGATSHMCTNQALLHSYRELTWGQTSRGFSSANGQLSHLVGIGNVTLEAEVPGDKGTASAGVQKVQPSKIVRLTLKDVHFYPTKGVNLLSWSQLKRSGKAAGMKLRLVEEEDSSLTVVGVESGLLGGREKEKVLMRFRLQGGLFVLDQPRKNS